MSIFKNHEGKLILLISSIITYPMFVKLNTIEFPNLCVTALASFIISFILADVMVRCIMDIIGSEVILYTKGSLEDSDTIILWNQAKNKRPVRIDITQTKFTLSIRIEESIKRNRRVRDIKFYILDIDGKFDKKRKEELFDSMQFSEYLDYSYFRDQILLKYKNMIKNGEEVYGKL